MKKNVIIIILAILCLLLYFSGYLQKIESNIQAERSMVLIQEAEKARKEVKRLQHEVDSLKSLQRK